VPKGISETDRQRLTSAGIMFIPVSDDIGKVRDFDPSDRNAFQVNTFAGLNALRALKQDTDKDSLTYTMSCFYVSRHIKLRDGMKPEDYIDAILDGKWDAIRDLCVEPIQPRHPEIEYERVSRPLIFA
jgi:hypothetical protein